MTERITKQQLKEDPLMRTTADAADFARHHSRLLVAAAAALVLLAAVIYFVKTGSERSAGRAAGMLADARGDFDKGAYDPAAARLEELVSTAGGTTAGKQALLLYGDVRYAQARYQEAAGYYKRALDKFNRDPVLGMAARRGLAATLENMKQFDEAAKIYEEIVAAQEPGPLKAASQMDLARALVRTGQIERAKAIYKELSLDASNPTLSQEAALRLAELNTAVTG